MKNVENLLLAADCIEPFDEICRDVVDRARQFYGSLRTNAKSRFGENDLDAGILHDSRLNAFVCQRNDQYVLRINSGAIEQLYGTMLSILSFPEFLPMLGNAKSECPPVTRFETVPRIAFTKESKDATATDAFLPKDQHRALAAHLLAEFALDFLVFHEIGHIVGGHLEIHTAYGMEAALSECEPDLPDGNVALCRAMECDADAFACHVATNVCLHEKLSHLVHQLLGATQYTNLELAHILYLTSIAVLYKLISSGNVKINDNGSTHPHPAVRACAVSTWSMARSVEQRKVPVEDLAPFQIAAVGGVETFWSSRGLANASITEDSQWERKLLASFHGLLDSYERHVSIFNEYSHAPRMWHDWEWPTEHAN